MCSEKLVRLDISVTIVSFGTKCNTLNYFLMWYLLQVQYLDFQECSMISTASANDLNFTIFQLYNLFW